jgi:hypothetical protein
MNRIDQYTPYGNLTYNQIGSEAIVDPTTGRTFNIPRYSATQTLSPAQQAILNETQGAQTNLAQTANERSAFLKDYLAKPFSLDNSAVEGRLFELGKGQLDPVYAKQQQDLEQNLASRGLKMGSGEYSRAIDEFNKSKAAGYNDLLLRGHQTATQDLLTERNQPLNEIGALLSGSQVQQPSYVSTPQANLPTVDYAGLVENQYSQQLQQYLQQQQQRQQLLGGLFGLGAAAFA